MTSLHVSHTNYLLYLSFIHQRKLQRCVSHMKSKHPEISLEGFGELTVSVNSDSPNQEFDDSLNSHETDVEEKEINNKEESKEYNSANEGGSHEDASDMIELRSMVWHHPITRKSSSENSLLGKSNEIKGSTAENIVAEKSLSQPEMDQELEKSDILRRPDTKPNRSSYGQNSELKRETMSDDSVQNHGSSETSTPYSASTCRVNKCKEMKSHFHCHLCDFIAFKV